MPNVRNSWRRTPVRLARKPVKAVGFPGSAGLHAPIRPCPEGRGARVPTHPCSGVSMALERPAGASPRGLGFVFLVATCLAAFSLLPAAPAHALKVATWNLLDYDDSLNPTSVTPRQPYYRTVMAAMDPDVIIVQELMTPSAADSFLNNVLNVVEPGQWTRGPFIQSTPATKSCAYWKPAKVNVTNSVSVSVGGTRNVLL